MCCIFQLSRHNGPVRACPLPLSPRTVGLWGQSVHPHAYSSRCMGTRGSPHVPTPQVGALGGQRHPPLASWVALGRICPCTRVGSQLGSGTGFSLPATAHLRASHPGLSHHCSEEPGIPPKSLHQTPPYMTVPKAFPGETLHSSI